MGPKKILIAFYALFRKEVIRFFRLWPQTLLPPVVTAALYFVIFGGVMGDKVGPIHGVPYLDFIVPGLILMTVINSSFANVVGSFYIAKFQREIEELLVSPMPTWAIIAGYVSAGVLRGLIASVTVLGVALFFWTPTIHHAGIVLLYLFLTSLVFSLAGLLNAIFARKFDDIAMFSTFILVPLTYLGGVFFTLEALPPFWREISRLNPILYMMSGFRYGFYGTLELNLLTGLSILVVLAALLAVLNQYLLERGVGVKE